MLRDDALRKGLLKPTAEEAKRLGLVDIAKEKAEADAAVEIADKELDEATVAEEKARQELFEYAELRFKDKKLDKRWGLKRLKAEVDKLEKGEN